MAAWTLSRHTSVRRHEPAKSPSRWRASGADRAYSTAPRGARHSQSTGGCGQVDCRDDLAAMAPRHLQVAAKACDLVSALRLSGFEAAHEIPAVAVHAVLDQGNSSRSLDSVTQWRVDIAGALGPSVRKVGVALTRPVEL